MMRLLAGNRFPLFHRRIRQTQRRRNGMRGIVGETLEPRQLLAADLVAHWSADRVTGANGADVTSWTDSVSGLVATATGSPKLVTNSFGGRTAIRFDAADGGDSLRVKAAQNPLNGAEDFSVAVAFWTNSTNLRGATGNWFTNTGLVDASALGFSQDWGVSLNANGQVAAGLGAGFAQPPVNVYSAEQGLQNEQLHVAIVTHAGNTLSISVDGGPAVSRDGAPTAARTPVELVFGNVTNNEGPYTGQLGEIRLYRGALSSAENVSLSTQIHAYYTNVAPQGAADQYTLNEDTPLFIVPAAQGVLANDTDADRDALTARLVVVPAHGQLALAPDGSFVYTPAKNYVGPDIFTYTPVDHRAGNEVTVELNIKPVYDPPVAVADSYKTTPTSVLHAGGATGLFENDFNLDQVTLRAVLSQPIDHGQLTLNVDGSFTYDPQGFAGEATFTYQVTDEQTTSAPALVRIVVNTPPDVRDDVYSAQEDAALTVAVGNGVTANDLDAENTPLQVTLVAGPAHGTLQLAANGSFTYTPAADYSGEDSFTYRVSDGVDTSARDARVVINVGAVNDSPLGVNDFYVVQGASLTMDASTGVLANDVDVDGPAMSALVETPPAFGTLQLAANGSFLYTPLAGFTGEDRFTYRVTDSIATSAPVEVLLVVASAQAGTSDPTGDVIVTFNELMYNPAGDDTGWEWIELHNQLAINMDISRWRLAGGVSFDFPEGTVIPGGGYLLVAADPAQLATKIPSVVALGPWTGRLDNGGEEIELRNNSDRVMDRMTYGDRGDWPVGADGSGASLAKLRPLTPSETADRWSVSSRLGGTPGVENFPPYDPTPIPTTLAGWGETFRYTAAPVAEGWQAADANVATWLQGGGIFQAGDPGFPPAAVGGLVEPGVSLINYWPLNATSGNVADNLVEGAADGALTQGPTWFADVERGFVLNTDGRNDYVAAGTLPAIGLQDDFTWSLWFKQDAANPANAVILGNRAGGPTDPLQFNKFTPTNFEYYHGAGGDPMLAYTLPVGAWQHLAVVKDGPSLTYYVNGQVVANATTTHDSAPQPLYFGGDPNVVGEFARGFYDDVAMWTRALPSEAIQGLHRGEYSPLTAPTRVQPGPIIPPGLPTDRTTLDANAPTVYFRREFEWDPASMHGLALTGLIGDGAIYYVNGQEVYRHNMPNGPVTRETPAAQEIDAIGATDPIQVPAALLRAGKNVLAVELHQSAVRGDALFATEMVAQVVPANLAEVRDPVLSELSSTTGPLFQVELHNPHTVPLALNGMQLVGADQPERAFRIPDLTLAPGQYIAWNSDQLSFRPTAGEALFLVSADGERIMDAQVADERLRGRNTQRDGQWMTPIEPTWGAANRFVIDSNIVINEIMYHAPGLYVQAMDTLFESGEEWIELYNRGGTETVSLSGWSIRDAISFDFPTGFTMAPGSYTVIAKDPAALLRTRPDVDPTRVLGPYERSLSNQNDRIVLRDALSNEVDVVHYYDEGRWPSEADGQAASLELRDPLADNSVAEAWAASREDDQSEWQTITLRGTGVGLASDPQQFHEFLMGLLDAGVVLIDDVRVIENPDTPNARQILQNGTFENDTLGANPATWRIIGTQHGAVAVDPLDPENQVLRLTATGATEHMHNNAGTTLKFGDSYVQLRNNNTYEVSFRAKWESGSNQVNSRLYFNRVGTTTRIDRPQYVGTPGQFNSRRVVNWGPTYSELIHSPAVPDADQPITVSVRANDPQGVQTLDLWYTVAAGPWTSARMTLGDDGHYAATIPGQAEGSLIQFYVSGSDGQGAQSAFPAAGADSRALIRVETADVLPAADPRQTVRILMTAADTDDLHRPVNVMSNDRRGATVIYNEDEIFYDVGIRLKGSQRGRNTSVRVGFSLSFDPQQLFRGVHSTIGVDRSGSGDEYSQEEIIVRQIVNHAGTLPQLYDDLIHVIAPRTTHTGSAMLSTARYNDVFLDSQYENGSDGTAFEYELIYYPTTTQGGVEGLKLPNPDNVTGEGFRDLGPNKENYRWHWLIKNNRREDDYQRLMAMLKAIGGRSTDPNFFPEIETLIDVDQWLRSFAVQNLAGIGDNYASGAQHNAQFYVRPSDQRVLYLPWDLDFSFTENVTGPLVVNGELRKLIAKPAYEHAYYGHIIDIVESTFNATYMNPWIDHFDQLVPGQSFFQGFKSFINRRAESARTQVTRAVTVVPFEITTVGPVDAGVASSVVLDGTGWVDVREIRLAGSPVPLNVEWVTDNQWRINVPVQTGSQDIVLHAYNLRGERIGEDTIQVIAGGVSALREHLRISEVHYNPAGPGANEPNIDNDLFEFVELVNTGTTALDLSGAQFTQIEREGNSEGIRFTFAAQTLDAGARLVVARDRSAFHARYGQAIRLADGEGDQGTLGAFSGQLDNGGETLTLVDATGGLIQQFLYDDNWYANTDGGGYSLEFIDTQLSDPDAWNLATRWSPSGRVGGSPGVLAAHPGDADFDGTFDTEDLMAAFQAGEYEDDIPNNSTWVEGDWNGDGDFTTRDLVYVFLIGGYAGNQPPVAAVAAAAIPASAAIAQAIAPGADASLECVDVDHAVVAELGTRSTRQASLRPRSVDLALADWDLDATDSTSRTARKGLGQEDSRAELGTDLEVECW